MIMIVHKKESNSIKVIAHNVIVNSYVAFNGLSTNAQ